MTTTMGTRPEVGQAVRGTCRCHRAGVVGVVEYDELTRVSGRPVRLLHVRVPGSTHLHELAAGNVR